MTEITATTRDLPAPLTDVRELFCSECGYGIVIRRDAPACPMCRASEWRQRPGFERWN